MTKNYLYNDQPHVPAIPNTGRSPMGFGFSTSASSITARKTQETTDTVEAFLDFIDRDIKENPNHVQPLSLDLLNRARLLVGNIEFDINEALCDEDE